MEDNEEVEEEVEEKPVTVFSAEYDRSQLPDYLRIYYTWIFPYERYFEWLHYGQEVAQSLLDKDIAFIDEESFSNREFSFTLEDDIYVRYQSYESRAALEEGIKKKVPYKIDIGAIFSHKVHTDQYYDQYMGTILYP